MKNFIFISIIILGLGVFVYLHFSKNGSMVPIPNDRAGLLKALLNEGGLEENKDQLFRYTDDQLKSLLNQVRGKR